MQKLTKSSHLGLFVGDCGLNGSVSNDKNIGLVAIHPNKRGALNPCLVARINHYICFLSNFEIRYKRTEITERGAGTCGDYLPFS